MLSTLLLVIVLDILTEAVTDGSIMDLLCTQITLFYAGSLLKRLWKSTKNGTRRLNKKI